MNLRWKLAIKLAGWIGGDDYRRTYNMVARLADDRMNQIDLVPTLEDKCVWYLVESHLTPKRNEKIDTLLGMFMIWRYHEVPLL